MNENTKENTKNIGTEVVNEFNCSYRKYNTNSLEILCSSNPDKYIFDNCIESVIQSFNNFCGDNISVSMNNLFIKNLKDFYVSKEIIRDDPNTYKNSKQLTFLDFFIWCCKSLFEKKTKNKSIQSLVLMIESYNNQWN